MAGERFPELLTLLEQSSAELGDVEVTRAHGCDAVRRGGRPYALVAPDGRIAVRLPDWDLFAAAYELPGQRAAVRGRRARGALGAAARRRARRPRRAGRVVAPRARAHGGGV